MTNGDKLQDLLVDEEELNEELLADTVGRYIGIGNESGAFYPNDSFNELNALRKVAVTLLAQTARHALSMAEDDRLTPTEISELSGVKKGTVYPKVRDLEKEGYARSDDGDYWIPSAKLREVRDFIEGGDAE